MNLIRFLQLLRANIFIACQLGATTAAKAWGFLVRTTVKSASLKRIPTCKRVDLPNRLTLIRSNYDEQVCHCLTLGTANAETILNC